MADVIQQYGGKSFGEAVSFFQKKLNIPTEHWDDLWQEQHAKGFMVAGAMKADLLADLRGAVEKALTDGETLADFRNRFDDIVQRHGWNYKGGRNWRTRVIYDTNFRTAYAAGRYKQMKDPDVVQLRPYWMYRHGDSKNPRLAHLALDGKVLPHDDPWWSSYYPPNGWGCRCRVVTLSQRDLDKMGRKGPDKSPEIRYETIEDDITGKEYKVPVGIDPGWNYNVGKAADQGFKVLADKFEKLPVDIAGQWMKEFVNEPAFEMFIDGKIKGEFPVAVLPQAFRTAIGARSQAVLMSDQTLVKIIKNHPDITLTEYKMLPDVVMDAQLVVKDGDLTEVFIRRGNQWYHAAIKSTKTGKATFLTSFRLTDEKDVERIKRKGEVLKDEL